MHAVCGCKRQDQTEGELMLGKDSSCNPESVCILTSQEITLLRVLISDIVSA